MKSNRRPRHILTPLTLILTLLLVAPGVTPAVTVGAMPPAREAMGGDRPGAETSPPAGLTADDWASMQDLIGQAQYQFAWQEIDGQWAYRAPNRANGLSLALAADGLHAARYDAAGELSWNFGLSLAAYGQQAFPTAVAADSLIGHRERVEYRWSEDVVEWYVNSAAGIEHGLTLAAPPVGADGATVELAFALHGSLAPELDDEGGTLHLKDAHGGTALRYDQLTVYDATGRALPARFSLSAGGHTLPAHLSLSPGGEGRGEGEWLNITIDAAGATYPLTVDPLLHGEVVKLVAIDAQDGDQFGYAVAISGDIVAVAAHLEDGPPATDDIGTVYLFERNRNGTDSWGQIKRLNASDYETGDQFGYSVAISGDTVVVGAPLADNVGGGGCVTGTDCGAVYVFERNRDYSGFWGEVTKLHASDAAAGDKFGRSVAISGDVIVVGAPHGDGASTDQGAAYIFMRNYGGADYWGQARRLNITGASIYSYFGESVDISGDTIVVGAWGEDAGGIKRGAAYVFERNRITAGLWGEVAELTASDTANEDLFGRSVAISGDTVVVGAWGEDGGGADRGAAYIFARNQGGADNWGEVAKLTASDGANNDYFGEAVSISGDTAVIGAWGEDGIGTDQGAVYVFERNRGGGDNWGQARKLTASDAQNGDSFGNAVAISGDTVIVGAPWEDSGVTNGNGAAYIFNIGGGHWQEMASPRAADTADEDRFGIAVAISDDTVVVGAEWEDGVGGDKRGAAYVFARNEDGADRWGQVTKLVPSNPENGAYFGHAVAISGDQIVVGAWGKDTAGFWIDQGTAYVFARNYNPSEPGVPLADNWGQVAELDVELSGEADVYFGWSVAISGDTAVVGAHGLDTDPFSNQGAAYVFERNQGGNDNWGLVQELAVDFGFESDIYFGFSVAISGDTVIVGADRENGAGTDRGSAYVFARNQGGADNWGLVKELTAVNPADGDRFGFSVGISGDTAVVGAYAHDGTGTDQGAAYIFERNEDGGDNWGQVKMLRALDAADEDNFGIAVAISGDTLVVGAHGDNGFGFMAFDYGAAYVFERNWNPNVPSAPVADYWGQMAKLRASDGGKSDYFGRAVAISGDTVVAGAYGEDGAGGTDRGAAYVFTLQPYQIFLPLVSNNG